MHSRDLLTAAADHAADHLEALPEAAWARGDRRRRPARGARRAAARRPARPARGPRRARRRAPAPGHRAQPVAALLRLRHRRRPARRARGRLAGLGVGPERRRLRRRAGRRRGRGGGRAAGWSSCSGCRRRVVRARHRLPDGARDLPGGGAPPRARAARAGTSSEAAWPARRRCASWSAGAPRHRSTAPCACSASAPPRSCASTPRRGRDGRAALRARAAPPATGRRSSARRPARSTRGAFDPLDEVCDAAAERGRVGARRRRLRPVGGRQPGAAAPRGRRRSAPTRGPPTPTSGSTSPTTAAWPSSPHPDAHRARRQRQRRLPAAPAARDACDWTPEFSRRARGIRRLRGAALARPRRASPSWSSAAARARGASPRASAGRSGVEVLNDVVLNQVLVRFGDDDAATDAVLAAVQAEGTCWMSATTWRGRRAMRISVSNWATTIATSIARAPRSSPRRARAALTAPAWIGSRDALARPAQRRRRARGGLPRDAPRRPRRGRGARRRRRCARGSRCPSRTGRPTRARSSTSSSRAATPGLVRSQSPRYFGYVIGGTLPGGARRRHGGRRLGPERRRLLGVAGRLGGRGGRRRLAARAARPPGGRVVRPDHRLPAGARHLPGRRAQRRARPRGLGRRGRRPAGRAARAPARQRGAPRDDRPRGADPRLRHRRRWCPSPSTRRAAWTRPRCATSSPPATGRRSCARKPATSTPAASIRSPRSSTPPHAAGAWVHVDGAFGLWAAASPRPPPPARRLRRRRLVGHRRPQVAQRAPRLRPGLRRRPRAHRNAMVVSAAYLRGTREGERDGSRWVPDFSRRGRGFAVYAALRSLGREGVAELVERCCACARRFAEVLGAEDGDRGPQRRRPQPGPRALRRRRRDDRRGGRRRAGRRHVLDEPDDVARPPRDAHLGLQLGDDDQRRGSLVRGDPGDRAPAGSGPNGTAARLTDGCPLQRVRWS